MPVHLFVYGTLLSGIPSSMSKFLRRRATLIGKATVPGTLYDLGLYPGYVTTGDGTVRGELYRLNEENLDETLEMLDAYESVTGAPEDEYVRAEVRAKVGDGGTFRAMTYAYTKDTDGKPVIPQGNYATFYPTSREHQRFVNGK